MYRSGDKACKKIKCKDDHALVKARREVELLIQCRHPNVVSVYWYGHRDGYFWYEMPVYPNTLRDGIPPKDTWKILYQIASALAHCHSLCVAHRDLTPNNILVNRTTMRAVICDFGAAKVLPSFARRHTIPITTYEYAAPELFKHEIYGFSIDIWSFGVISYELLTGKEFTVSDPKLEDIVSSCALLEANKQEDLSVVTKQCLSLARTRIEASAICILIQETI